MADELWRLGALGLAALLRAGTVSAREVVAAHLERLEAVNPQLNAVVRTMAAEAIAEAELADRSRAAGARLGVLHGVPITVKENLDVAGTPTTHGVRGLANAVAPLDAPVVERLRAAGAIVIGRTNLPDLGLRVSTDSSLHGLTRNPWHRRLTAGGSSGGEASALAAGISPLGIGNDIGGSLRSPAHCCGICSLKPTPGRLPRARSVGPREPTFAEQLMAVDGPLARSVEDLRVALRLMSGPHTRDPGALPVPLADAVGAGRLRVALVPEPPGGRTDGGVAEIVRSAGCHLAAAGFDVEERLPPGYEECVECWKALLFSELRTAREVLVAQVGEAAARIVEVAARHPAATTDLARYLEVLVCRRRLAAAWSAFFEDVDLVVSPVWCGPAFPHGWDAENEEQMQATTELVRPTLPANLIGLPAAVAPGGLAAGMPVGVQFVAAPFREDRALAAAAVLEQAVGILTPVEPFVHEG